MAPLFSTHQTQEWSILTKQRRRGTRFWGQKPSPLSLQLRRRVGMSEGERSITVKGVEGRLQSKAENH